MAANKARKSLKKTARKTKGAKATRGKASSASQAKAKRALRPAPKAASHKAAGKLPKKAALAKKPEAAARPAKRERPAAAQNGANGKAAAAPAQQARAAGDSAVRRKSGDGAAQRDGARSASARPRAGGGREGALRVRGSAAPEPAAREAPRVVPLPLPMLPPVRRPSVEERSASIDVRLEAQGDDFKHRYLESFDMSWIYHDSALEGVVYTFDELRAALGGEPPPVSDSGLQPTFDDIRRHKEAIDFVRDFAIKKRLPVTLDVVKKLYLILHPEEGDIKTVKYRKDIPQHRLYFHEYAPPDKIAYKVRQIVDWLNDPETRKTRNGIRIAARAHYDLLRVYPFPVDSGKVSRLFMNLLLLRSGLPPSIIHSTERQRYYEALKGSATTVLQMVQESVENALSSVEKLLDEHESRKRAFVS